MKSTLHLGSQGIALSPDWTTVITNLRIHHEPNHGHLHPWVLDGINVHTLELTEDVEYHPTFADAIADMPAFVERYELKWASRMIAPTVQRLIDVARDLIEDGASPDYTDALVHLIHDFEPIPGVEGGDQKRELIERLITEN